MEIRIEVNKGTGWQVSSRFSPAYAPYITNAVRELRRCVSWPVRSTRLNADGTITILDGAS